MENERTSVDRFGKPDGLTRPGEKAIVGESSLRAMHRRAADALLVNEGRKAGKLTCTLEILLELIRQRQLDRDTRKAVEILCIGFKVCFPSDRKTHVPLPPALEPFVRFLKTVLVLGVVSAPGGAVSQASCLPALEGRSQAIGSVSQFIRDAK
jgi:hypothetical protein